VQYLSATSSAMRCLAKVPLMAFIEVWRSFALKYKVLVLKKSKGQSLQYQII
jgi:hypothetical protein